MTDFDCVLPFHVPDLNVRGRIVRLGPMLRRILNGRDYPENVIHLLAQAVALTALLGSALKGQGKFILQTQSEGAVSLMAVECRTREGVADPRVADPGVADSVKDARAMRAYARFDAEKAKGAEPAALAGKGTLAMTVDQGHEQKRYQGLVPMEANQSLQDAAHFYFGQSEQVPTKLRLAVEGRGESLCAGAIMVQLLPEQDAKSEVWRQAAAMTDSLEDQELTDPELTGERILYRLFHSWGVCGFDPIGLKDECGCSARTVKNVLSGLSEKEREECVKDGMIEAVCEFCAKRHRFSPAQFKKAQ